MYKSSALLITSYTNSMFHVLIYGNIILSVCPPSLFLRMQVLKGVSILKRLIIHLFLYILLILQYAL